MSDEELAHRIISTGEATAILPMAGARMTPITVIGTEAIRSTFDSVCLEQAMRSRMAPGVAALVLNPDAHRGRALVHIKSNLARLGPALAYVIDSSASTCRAASILGS